MTPGPVPRCELPALHVDEQFIDQIATVVAERVARRLRDDGDRDDGYLNADAAARYLGITRKRVHDLTSLGALVPDGRDGRKPLYRKRTLDAYVQGPDA